MAVACLVEPGALIVVAPKIVPSVILMQPHIRRVYRVQQWFANLDKRRTIRLDHVHVTGPFLLVQV